jgi:hypothetical protein
VDSRVLLATAKQRWRASAEKAPSSMRRMSVLNVRSASRARSSLRRAGAGSQPQGGVSSEATREPERRRRSSFFGVSFRGGSRNCDRQTTRSCAKTISMSNVLARALGDGGVRQRFGTRPVQRRRDAVTGLYHMVTTNARSRRSRPRATAMTGRDRLNLEAENNRPDTARPSRIGTFQRLSLRSRLWGRQRWRNIALLVRAELLAGRGGAVG